jgi:hypothetical protein
MKMVKSIVPYLPRAIGIVTMVSFAMALVPMAQASPVPFMYVDLPDMQDETDNAPQMIQSDVNWIANNQASKNIAYVGQLGDITNGSAANEFQTAHNALFPLNNVSGLVWGTVPGDHDSIPPSGVANYVSYFGAANFTGQSWYGSSNSSTGASSYQVFQQGGRSYLVLDLEYHAAFPSTAEINWAQGIINSHLGMPTLLQTHQYLNYDGTLLSGEGTTMWNNLVNNNSQIFMVTCGHVENGATIDGGEAFTTATDAAGKSVYEVLSNYQSIDNTGDGLMRLFQFDEANSKINVSLYSPYVSTYNNLNDPNTNFSISMNFDSRLGAAVPEPSTLVLAAAGAVVLLGYGWRRRRSA